MRTEADLTKLVNQSGFPLQAAVEDIVNGLPDSTNWHVLYREHGWKHHDGQSGFIDLVLEDTNGTSILVVECKRVLDSDWIFLDPEPVTPPTKASRLWATNTAGHGVKYHGYFDLKVRPESPESMFCVVAGQDTKSRPMLERVASEISSATEALASEEHPIIQKRDYGLRLYASVVVTTARLHFSRFDPREVSRDTGEAPKVYHKQYPWIRFRKQLTSDLSVEPKDLDWNFSELALAKEKQVFIVNLQSLAEFLAKWEVENASLRRLLQP